MFKMRSNSSTINIFEEQRDELKEKFYEIQKKIQKEPKLMITMLDEIINGYIIATIRDDAILNGVNDIRLEIILALFRVREEIVKTKCYESGSNYQE